MTDLSERLRSAAPRPTVPLDVAAVELTAGRRDRQRRVALVASVAAALVIAVVVVAALQDRSDTEGLDVVGDPDPMAGVPVGSWVELLAHIPADVNLGTTTVEISDAARVRAQAGVAPLEPGASDEAVAAEYLTVLRPRGLLSTRLVPTPGISPAELRAELGFTPAQIDRAIAIGAMPNTHYVAIGRFDPNEIDKVVRADPMWGPRLEVKSYKGVDYYSWGGDYQTSAEDFLTPVRRLGQGGRLVVSDGWLSWTLGDAEATAAIDAFLDPRTSLAVHPALRSFAEQADSAQLTGQVMLPVDDENATIWGLGERVTDTMVKQVGLAYGTEDQAGADLARFSEAARAALPGAELEVSQRGPVVFATFNGPVDVGSNDLFMLPFDFLPSG
jgi:hypothetical protein